MHDITVIVARPQRDRQAQDILAANQVITHRFMERVRVRRRRKRACNEFRDRCLHQRYLFSESSDRIFDAIRADHAAPRPSIQGILGGTSRGSLAPLQAIHGREVSAPAERPKPLIGESVTLRSGPLEGWRVTVRALHGHAFSAECRSGKMVAPVRLPYTHLHPG